MCDRLPSCGHVGVGCGRLPSCGHVGVGCDGLPSYADVDVGCGRLLSCTDLVSGCLLQWERVGREMPCRTTTRPSLPTTLSLPMVPCMVTPLHRVMEQP